MYFTAGSPLGNRYSLDGWWKASSKNADLFTSVQWSLLRFLLINAAVLEYTVL